MTFFDSRVSVFFLTDVGGFSRNLSSYLVSIEGLPGPRELNDVSNLAAAGRQWTYGLEHVTFGISGYFNDAAAGPDVVLADLRTSTIARDFLYGPTGTASGYTGSCWVRSYDIKSRVGNIVAFEATMVAEGTIGFGSGGGGGGALYQEINANLGWFENYANTGTSQDVSANLNWFEAYANTGTSQDLDANLNWFENYANTGTSSDLAATNWIKPIATSSVSP